MGAQGINFRANKRNGINWGLKEQKCGLLTSQCIVLVFTHVILKHIFQWSPNCAFNRGFTHTVHRIFCFYCRLKLINCITNAVAIKRMSFNNDGLQFVSARITHVRTFIIAKNIFFKTNSSNRMKLDDANKFCLCEVHLAP